MTCNEYFEFSTNSVLCVMILLLVTQAAEAAEMLDEKPIVCDYGGGTAV